MKTKNVTMDILGRKVNGFICEGDGNFYHYTRARDMKKILEDGFIKPSAGEYGTGSNSVSFSASKYQVYPSGEVRIVFNGKKIGNMLKPMVYYNHRKVNEEIGEHIDDIMEDYGRDRGMGVNEIPTFFGATLDIYANECEWFTTKPVPANGDTILEICYLIPWRIVDEGWGTQSISCERTSPQYAFFENSWAFGMEHFLERVKNIKQVVLDYRIPFVVDSCYAFLEERTMYSTRKYRLDDNNLERIANGEKPVPIDRQVDESEHKCKC